MIGEARLPAFSLHDFEADMENDEPRRPNRMRENAVILTLVLFSGAVFLFFLDLISLGLFTNAIGVGAAVLAVGCFHYLVWGRAMTEEVAAEREAMLLKEEQEAEAREHPEGIQDLGRLRGIKRGRPGR
jgi:hypothetical protein